MASGKKSTQTKKRLSVKTYSAAKKPRKPYQRGVKVETDNRLVPVTKNQSIHEL